MSGSIEKVVIIGYLVHPKLRSDFPVWKDCRVKGFREVLFLLSHEVQDSENSSHG